MEKSITIMALIEEQENMPIQIRPIIINLDGLHKETEQAGMNVSACSCYQSCGSNFSRNGQCACYTSCGSNYSR